MNHIFNVDIATKYGVDVAILLQNLDFWIGKNIANDKHFYDGNYWTYNSQEAFTKLFPYWNRGQIQRILAKLETEKLIIKGNYNKTSFDKTCWYALTKKYYSIIGNQIPDCTKLNNGEYENEPTIPYINTDINTDINIIPPTPKIEYEGFNEKEQEAIQDWLDYKSEKKDKYKPTGMKALLTIIKKEKTKRCNIVDAINFSISNNWKGIVYEKGYPDRANNYKQSNNKNYNILHDPVAHAASFKTDKHLQNVEDFMNSEIPF